VRFLVGATGFEPATSCSQNTRATNCATPRSERKRYHISLIVRDVSPNNIVSRDNQWSVDYDQSQAYIASLAPRGWRLGLDRMAEFARRIHLDGSLGESDCPKFIHVTGTNGKGSVTAMVQSCLIEQGYRTGSFFSPFVVDPRERIQFGRELISKEDLAQISTDLLSIEQSLSETEFGGVTEFEFKAAMGFEYWKRKNCEWVALEVGLGGRLDATNIVTSMASAIVSISYDHVSILGKTLREIAREKAGIIKPGRPVVVGEMPEEAFREIERIAFNCDSPLWRLGYQVQWQKTLNGVLISTPGSTIEVQPSLFGDIQFHNASVAYAALEIAGAIQDSGKVAEGFRKVSLPGRFQRMKVHGKELILDGAHNADSAEALSNMLIQAGVRPQICITGMLTGHTAKEFFEPLRHLVGKCYVCPIDFHRTVNPNDLHDELQKMGFESEVFNSVSAALDAAFQNNDAENILVCGSFYLVGEAMRLLQSQY
jgi:dihydrofolate synthase/folylpolyglutamate synthase